MNKKSLILFLLGLLAAYLPISKAELTAQSQGLLEATNINESGPMKNLGLRLGGWIDAGVTYNANDPADKNNGPTSYADRDSELQMNQLYLYLERPVNRQVQSGIWAAGPISCSVRMPIKRKHSIILIVILYHLMTYVFTTSPFPRLISNCSPPSAMV